MTLQKFKAALALSVGITAIMAAGTALAKDPELSFHPAKPWVVGEAPETGEVSTGGTQLCSIQTEFNNGFIMKLGGSEKWVETLVMDFRQDSFTPGDAYKINLAVPGKTKKTLSAHAAKANVLVVNLKGQKELYHAMRDSSVVDMQLQENNFRFYLTGFTPQAKNFERCMAGGPMLKPESPTREASADATVNESIALEEAAKHQAKIEISPENPQVTVAAIPYTEKTKIGGVEVKPDEQMAIDITATPDAPEAEEAAAADNNTPILMAKQDPEKHRLTEMLDAEISQNPEMADIGDEQLAPPPPEAALRPPAAAEAAEIPEEAPAPETTQAESQTETPAEALLAQPEQEAPVLDGHAVIADASTEEKAAQAQAEPAQEPITEITVAEPVLIEEPATAPEAASPAAPVVAPAAPAAVKSGVSQSTIDRLRAMAAAQLAEPSEQAPAPEAQLAAAAEPSAAGEAQAAALLDEPAKQMPAPETLELQTASIDASMTPEPAAAMDITEPADEAEAQQASPPPVPVEPVTSEQAPEVQIPPPAQAKFHRQTASIEADLTDMGQQKPAEDEPFSQFEKRGPIKQHAAAPAAADGGDPAVMKKIAELEDAVNRLQTENSSLNDELKMSIKESEGERMSVSSENWNLEQATMRFNESERQIRGLGEQIQKERAQCLMEKRDLESQLFDPQITSQEQLARLAELEQQLAAAQAKLAAMGAAQ